MPRDRRSGGMIRIDVGIDPGTHDTRWGETRVRGFAYLGNRRLCLSLGETGETPWGDASRCVRAGARSTPFSTIR